MNIQLNISEKDSNNEEIILSKDNEQVMMEWEKTLYGSFHRFSLSERRRIWKLDLDADILLLKS